MASHEKHGESWREFAWYRRSCGQWGHAYHVSAATPRSRLSQQLDGEGDLERNRLMKNKQNPNYLRLDDGVMRVRDEVQVDTIVGRLRYESRSRRY